MMGPMWGPTRSTSHMLQRSCKEVAKKTVAASLEYVAKCQLWPADLTRAVILDMCATAHIFHIVQ